MKIGKDTFGLKGGKERRRGKMERLLASKFTREGKCTVGWKMKYDASNGRTILWLRENIFNVDFTDIFRPVQISILHAWKFLDITHWGKKKLFIQEFDVWKMWILWKMRFQKGEFCKNWDFQCVNFWIKNGFLPQRVNATFQNNHTGSKIHILSKNSHIENPNFYKIHLSEI